MATTLLRRPLLARKLALAGDDAGAATWRRIMAAVTQLANNAPPGRVR
jgi:hypothetical protein